MGLREILTGRRRLAAPAPDRLFAMSTAYVTMQTELGFVSAGRAAIVFQSLATADFHAIVRDMEEVVRATAAEGATTVTSQADDYGFSWMILGDADLDDLVVGVNAVSTALQEGGYGERILCAVFAFDEDLAGRVRRLYWIYNYKRGAFYPFVPVAGGGQRRDNERELQLRAQLASELPIEAELTRWFALWSIPL